MYGFLGGYPSFLQENLHYTPDARGQWSSASSRIGALASIAGGWLGDRLSPRLVLSARFVCIAVLGYLFFQQSLSPDARNSDLHLRRQWAARSFT